MTTRANDTALADILVVEIGGRVGAGVCGGMLAQLGAETVLVEMPPAGAFAGGKARWRDQFAAGKLSFRPDADNPDDVDLLRRLVAAADVVILSGDVDPPLAAEATEAAGDGAVVCDITAYGAGAPKDGRRGPASDWRLQAETGVADTTGRKDGPPVPAPLPVVEYMTGVYAAAAVVAALRVRRLGGGGQFIDMALYDSGFASLATFFPKLLLGGKDPVERAGNNHALISPWNVYKAADGWILICAGSDAQWERLCTVMGRGDVNDAGDYARMAARITYRADVDAIITEWTQAHTVAECAEALNAASLSNGAIVTLDPHPDEPNLAHRGMIRQVTDADGRTLFVAGSPMIMSATPGRAPDRLPAPDADRAVVAGLIAGRAPAAAQSNTQPAAPLAGLRVVEVGHYTTVPLSTRHMGALGADVIKVEPPGGEATRGWLPVHEGRSFYFAYVNSDKRSLVLDLASDDGMAAFRRLIETADVLIENLKPGALARRGFSADDIARINPRLIYCAVSGFGHDSLYAGRPAYDSVVQAMSGIMDVVRDDGTPMKAGISIVDLLGAETALVAVLAALEYRDRTGRGQFVDLSMQDIAAWMTQVAWNGATEPAVPLTVVACADGHVLAEASPEAVAEAAGGDVTMDGAQGASALARADLADRLTGAGLAAVPILPVHEVIAAKHTQRRKLWFTVPDAGVDWPLLASAMQLTRTPPRVCRPMPQLGQDDADILAELGMVPPAADSAD
ncbi:MAG TPA: hypothetical protein DCG48_13220 [Rhodospirillaceae bacterium]|nr:hypothetical protein [Rhodospirillaceae bacterium]